MRTYTRDQVEEVIDVIHMEETHGEDFEAGATEVLRRLDALHASAPPSPARGVPEGFAGTLDHVLADVRYGGDGPESHVHQLRLLMFRFPDGSLAPHVEAVEGAPYAGECLMELTTLVHLMRNVGQVEAFQIGNRDVPNPPTAPEGETGHAMESKRPILDLYGIKGAVQRPRATTPTPDVPALLERHEECDGTGGEDGRCQPCEGTGMVASEPVPEVPALKADSTSTEVVWENHKQTIRVRADGTWERDPDKHRLHWDISNMARALAAAKRDQDSQLRDAVRRALEHLRANPTGRVGDAITTLSDALEGRR